MFQFGNPNLFAQGVVDQTLYDPETGNVIGYDRLGTDVALNYTFDFSEITGGFQNQLAGLIPHTTRLTGTYTSAAFSMEARALLSGGDLSAGGIAPVCEVITASSANLTVSKTPAKSYGQSSEDRYCWCQVREHGTTSYSGQNYGIDASTKQVQGFAAVSGTQYDVFYFTVVASSQVLGLPVAADPSAATVVQKWGIYASQNGSKKSGTLQGFLYVTVPLAILEGDAGMNGNQTTNTTSNYNWRAITNNENVPSCNSCERNDNNYAYYVYVPCGDSDENVAGIYVVGSGITVKKGNTVQLPVKLYMKNGTVSQPDYSSMTYTSSASSTASVDSSGRVTGVAAGNANITIKYTKEDGTVYTATAAVTVVA